MTSSEFRTAVDGLPFGKHLPTARYIFAPTEADLPVPLADFVGRLRAKLGLSTEFNVLKLSAAEYALSFLRYPGFLTEAHPALAESVRVSLATGAVRRTDFGAHSNPPILHRKECFLPPSHPKRKLFTDLTRAEEQAGLYEETSRIGFRENWQQLLREKRLLLRGHRLHADASVPVPEPDQVASEREAPITPEPTIHRHRTALTRSDLSKPVRLAMETGLLREGDTFFDFGCGLGSDVAGLRAMGIDAAGWDPAYFPEKPHRASRVVNLGFVLNVIEKPAERVTVLQSAWALATDILVVSTLVQGQDDYATVRSHADGCLTSRGTFQKYFQPAELQALIEHALEAEAFPLGLGIYVVFRHPSAAQDWMARRTRRVIDWENLSRRLGFLRPRLQRRAVDLYEIHKSLLDACWERMLDLGRFPTETEFPQLATLRDSVGSPRTVHRIFVTRFGEATLEAARAQRRDDLLAYLALANFRKKVPLKYLSERLQIDIRTFCGTYEAALSSARALLFAAGDSRHIEAACETFPHGLQDEDSLQIHRSLLPELPAILRVYILCAARVYGDPDEADVIKIHKHSGKVTFQYYEGFFDQPFPLLAWRIKINLRHQSAEVFDHRLPRYRQHLCFKDRLLGPEHPERPASERLSQRLRKLGVSAEDVGYGLTPQQLSTLRQRFGLTDLLLRGRK